MSDEAIQNQDELVGNPAEETEGQVAESQTGDQTQEQKPEWANRYKSPDDMWEDVRRFQSEADTYKRQVEEFRQSQRPEQPQTATQVSNEELIEQFAKDPKGFIEQFTIPIKAQLALQDFARTHPDIDRLRPEMGQLVQARPEILAHPEGLEMVYNHVKAKHNATRVADAANVMQQRREQVEQTKRTDAFVESSTAPQRGKTPVITPEMSTEEMDKALDEAGIGWITDEERHKFEE